MSSAPEFKRVRKGAIVFQNDLRGVQLQGQPRLVHEPHDFDPTYLARHEVRQESLPRWMRDKRGASITLFSLTSFHGDGELTPPETDTVGTVAAYGWLDDTPDLNHKGVEHMVFTNGSQYLAAELTSPYEFYWWATFEPASSLRLWEVRRASKRLERAALTEVQTLPSYRIQQSEYRTFLKRLSAAYAKVDELRAKDPEARKRLEGFEPPVIPSTWSVRETTGLWTVTGESAPGLLVGYYRGWDSYRVPTTGIRGEGEDIDFDGTLLVVWTFDEGREEIESVLGDLVPDQTTGLEMWGFVLRGGLSSPGGPPALLFTAPLLEGVLSPIDGHYVVDRKLMLRPAEFRKSARPTPPMSEQANDTLRP